MIFLDLDFGYFLGAPCGLVVRVTIVHDVDRTWTWSICMGYNAVMPEAYIIAEDKRAPPYASQRTPLEDKRAVDVTKRVWKGNGRGNSKRQAKRRKIFSYSVQHTTL
jgi:hypothetical protein